MKFSFKAGTIRSSTTSPAPAIYPSSFGSEDVFLVDFFHASCYVENEVIIMSGFSEKLSLLRRQAGMKRDTAGTYTQGKGKSNTGGKTLPFLQQEDSGQSQKTGNEWKKRACVD